MYLLLARHCFKLNMLVPLFSNEFFKIQSCSERLKGSLEKYLKHHNINEK